MKKGKKWTLRLLGVAALALLICLCLLGSTMARYTSSGTGKGELTVALWDLEVTGAESGELELSTDPISPSEDPYYVSEVAQARTNTSDWVAAFTMVNNSAVDATVEIEMVTKDETEGATVDLTWADDFTWGTGWTTDNGTNEYGVALMSKFGFIGDDAYCKAAFISLVNTWGVISLELSTDKATDPGSGVTSFTDDNALYLYGFTSTYYNEEVNDRATIYAEVVWNSIYEGDFKDSKPEGFSTWEEFSDAVDTILGMYVTTISFDVEWTAVQASHVPDNT